jgi:hypothetical protein
MNAPMWSRDPCHERRAAGEPASSPAAAEPVEQSSENVESTAVGLVDQLELAIDRDPGEDGKAQSRDGARGASGRRIVGAARDERREKQERYGC